MTSEEMLVRAAIQSWKTVIGRLDGIVAGADDVKMERTVVPGGNRVHYLVGHLVAVHDRMLPLLGLGERLHAELDEAYLENPDRTKPDSASAAELKAAWVEVNGKLTAGLEAFSPSDWLSRHNSVSEEDFAKDPSRNKLAVLLSRTNHASTHLGQLLIADKSS
jgi:hypothetical protein